MTTGPGAGTILGPRLLGRATLGRQHLLDRVAMPAPAMIEHLVGMQAQVPENPYVGLWSRTIDFEPGALSTLIEDRAAVRAGLMRGTLHLVTAQDYVALEPLMRPVLERLLQSGSPFGRRLIGLDLDELLATGRSWFTARPRTRAQLVPLLAERWPDRDAPSLAYALTYLLPLVQVPPRGVWHRSGPSAFTTAETWLGRQLDGTSDPEAMVLRYLAAYGPAAVADMRAWSGVSGLAAVVERLRPRLATFRDEGGRELFDLPDAPWPAPDTPAPVRFLPEYDNVLLGFADRSRFGIDERVRAFFGDRPIGLGPVLVDGLVRGSWRVRHERRTATMDVRILGTLAPVWSRQVDAEASALLDFLASGSEDREVRRASSEG